MIELDFEVACKVDRYKLYARVADGHESLGLWRKSTFRLWKSRRMSKGLRLTATAASALARATQASLLCSQSALRASMLIASCTRYRGCVIWMLPKCSGAADDVLYLTCENGCIVCYLCRSAGLDACYSGQASKCDVCRDIHSMT